MQSWSLQRCATTSWDFTHPDHFKPSCFISSGAQGLCSTAFFRKRQPVPHQLGHESGEAKPFPLQSPLTLSNLQAKAKQQLNLFSSICFDAADSCNTVVPAQWWVPGHAPSCHKDQGSPERRMKKGWEGAAWTCQTALVPRPCRRNNNTTFPDIRKHWLLLTDVCAHPTTRRNAETPCFCHHQQKASQRRVELPGLKTFYFISAAFALQL